MRPVFRLRSKVVRLAHVEGVINDPFEGQSLGIIRRLGLYHYGSVQTLYS